MTPLPHHSKTQHADSSHQMDFLQNKSFLDTLHVQCQHNTTQHNTTQHNIKSGTTFCREVYRGCGYAAQNLVIYYHKFHTIPGTTIIDSGVQGTGYFDACWLLYCCEIAGCYELARNSELYQLKGTHHYKPQFENGTQIFYTQIISFLYGKIIKLNRPQQRWT